MSYFPRAPSAPDPPEAGAPPGPRPPAAYPPHAPPSDVSSGTLERLIGYCFAAFLGCLLGMAILFAISYLIHP